MLQINTQTRWGRRKNRHVGIQRIRMLQLWTALAFFTCLLWPRKSPPRAWVGGGWARVLSTSWGSWQKGRACIQMLWISESSFCDEPTQELRLKKNRFPPKLNSISYFFLTKFIIICSSKLLQNVDFVLGWEDRANECLKKHGLCCGLKISYIYVSHGQYGGHTQAICWSKIVSRKWLPTTIFDRFSINLKFCSKLIVNFLITRNAKKNLGVLRIYKYTEETMAKIKEELEKILTKTLFGHCAGMRFFLKQNLVYVLGLGL